MGQDLSANFPTFNQDTSNSLKMFHQLAKTHWATAVTARASMKTSTWAEPCLITEDDRLICHCGRVSRLANFSQSQAET